MEYIWTNIGYSALPSSLFGCNLRYTQSQTILCEQAKPSLVENETAINVYKYD